MYNFEQISGDISFFIIDCEFKENKCTEAIYTYQINFLGRIITYIAC